MVIDNSNTFNLTIQDIHFSKNQRVPNRNENREHKTEIRTKLWIYEPFQLKCPVIVATRPLSSGKMTDANNFASVDNLRGVEE